LFGPEDKVRADDQFDLAQPFSAFSAQLHFNRNVSLPALYAVWSKCSGPHLLAADTIRR